MFNFPKVVRTVTSCKDTVQKIYKNKYNFEKVNCSLILSYEVYKDKTQILKANFFSKYHFIR